MIIVSQMLGGIALALWVWSIQKKDKSQILKLQSLANLFYGAQYLALGLPATSVMNIISILRNLVYSVTSKKDKIISVVSLLFFLTLIGVVGAFTFNGYLSLIPIFLTFGYTYVSWQKNNKTIRWFFIFAAIVWICYNFQVKAYVSAVGNIFEIISGYIAVVRFDLTTKNSKIIKNLQKVFLMIGILVLIAITFITSLYFKPRVPVLCYHNIGTEEDISNFPEEENWTVSIENFEEHLKYLYDNDYKTLTLEEFYAWKQGNVELPFKSVLITFDDGFLSNYEYAFPLLKKYNMNATVFIVGQYIENGKDKWENSLHDYISKDIIGKCKQEYPNITFASHSYSLHELGSINADVETLEKDAIAFKTNILDTQCYCYPNGDYNENMIQALKNTGYKLSFRYGPNQSDYRKASREDEDYEIPRLNVSHGMNKLKFALRLWMPF